MNHGLPFRVQIPSHVQDHSIVRTWQVSGVQVQRTTIGWLSRSLCFLTPSRVRSIYAPEVSRKSEYYVHRELGVYALQSRCRRLQVGDGVESPGRMDWMLEHGAQRRGESGKKGDGGDGRLRSSEKDDYR